MGSCMSPFARFSLSGGWRRCTCAMAGTARTRLKSPGIWRSTGGDVGELPGLRTTPSTRRPHVPAHRLRGDHRLRHQGPGMAAGKKFINSVKLMEPLGQHRRRHDAVHPPASTTTRSLPGRAGATAVVPSTSPLDLASEDAADILADMTRPSPRRRRSSATKDPKRQRRERFEPKRQRPRNYTSPKRNTGNYTSPKRKRAGTSGASATRPKRVPFIIAVETARGHPHPLARVGARWVPARSRSGSLGSRSLALGARP
jgi:hypothetical protein